MGKNPTCPQLLAQGKHQAVFYKKKNLWCFIRIHSSEARGTVTTTFPSDLEDQQAESNLKEKLTVTEKALDSETM